MMKVLMIGLGSIGQRHVRNLRALYGEALELLAYRKSYSTPLLTDQFQVERGIEPEAKYNIQSFDHLDQALAQKPEIAFICNPTSLHLPVAVQAAKAGCHLFIEKPVSHSLDGLDELTKIIEKNHLVAYVGYQMRYHPCLKLVKAWLTAGAIGSVLAVRAETGEYLPGWHTYEDYRQMYASRRDLGGGAILSQIHEMDYLNWLFGLPRRVFAIGGHLSSLEIDVEDIASTLMEINVEGHAIPVHLQQDYLQKPPSRTLQIIGDQGKILVDFIKLSTQCFKIDGQPVVDAAFMDFQRNQLFLDELAQFVACVRGEDQPAVSLQDGIQSLRMALAAKESMETHKIVELA